MEVNVLVADRVFIALPDQTTPCIAIDPIICPSGEVLTYTLSNNRCLVPTVPPCMTLGFCPLLIRCLFRRLHPLIFTKCTQPSQDSRGFDSRALHPITHS
eukprot:TRINITY_DN3685_c0_g2_i1.p1 TRINITY_DN3685_c0_g2~~TRINITY_DN3685_c0_g2_i1.p1  ORF type:complete len:100 (-),score=8.52 TRINITY_DN3685_c0_g2_i1:184-483(-)